MSGEAKDWVITGLVLVLLALLAASVLASASDGRADAEDYAERLSECYADPACDADR